MNRRTFMGVFAPFALAGVALAQEEAKKKSSTTPRISGRVQNTDSKSMVIEVRPSRAGNVIRKVMYDANTQFMTDNKPGSAEDAKQGVRIVAVGDWDGVNLKAKKITLLNNR